MNVALAMGAASSVRAKLSRDIADSVGNAQIIRSKFRFFDNLPPPTATLPPPKAEAQLNARKLNKRQNERINALIERLKNRTQQGTISILHSASNILN